MRRIAYCSPVNPVPSGISDYSEELLPYLGQYAEVVLFVERGIKPENQQLREQLTVRSMDELPALHRKQPFDAIIYHIGNSPVHGTIYELAQRIPGVVVLHEWVLHHLKLWHAAERRNDIGVYLREMQQRYGPAGERVARKMSRGQIQDAAFTMPLVEDVVEGALGVIGHSRFVVDQAQRLKANLHTVVVPMGVPLPRIMTTSEARVQLGLPQAAPIWASFGHINPYKRMESALRAFKQFHGEHTDARYILVGSVSPSYDLQSLIKRLGLADAVTVTNYVPRDDFERYVAAADVCLNLRSPSAGETSASLLRLLGAGRPTLISAVGAFAELPDDVCAKVDADWSEMSLILAYTRLFHDQPLVAEQLGRNARTFVAREHSLQRAAEGYIRFLSEVYGWGNMSVVRNVLWEVGEQGIENREPRTKNREPIIGSGEQETEKKEQRIEGREQETRSVTVIDEMIEQLGTAAAELGLREDDVQPLQNIATTLHDLLDDPPSAGRRGRRWAT